jgi:hypothetical protein
MTEHVDGAPAPAPAEDWQGHRVMIHHGALDTRAGTKRPYETMTLGEIFEMEPDCQPKDRAMAMLQSSYHAPDGRTHQVQKEHGSFVCLCMDIDIGDKSLGEVAAMVDAFTGEEVASLIYSSSSAETGNRKWRVVVPLESQVPFAQWSGAMMIFFGFAEVQGIIVDQSLARTGQPVYLPNVPPTRRGADGKPKFYEFERVQGRGLRMTDPGLAQWWQTWQAAQRDQTPNAKTEPNPLASALRQAAQAVAPSPINRFNAAHRIEDLMERYGYTPRPGGGGHWRSPLQTSDSYATQVRTGDDGGQYWVSLSDSDAAAGLGGKSEGKARYGDAFDLFCQFEHGGDRQAALAAWKAREAAQTGLQGHPVALDWGSLPESPPEPPFVIPEWLAAGVVTLLAAHGGVGKSHLSIYIAICLATGRHPFEPGASIDRVRVILYSAEDSLLILQGRIVRYLRMLGVSRSDLDGWLEVLDATNSDNVLFSASGVTPRFEWLRERAQQTGAQVLVFDNASDGFSGNEIDRAQVRQFMTALRQVAPTVLLLAHVDAASSMADMETAKGYSGSTAWHNSARARWFMAKDKKTDEVTLELKKTNYGRAGAQAILGWDETYSAFRVMQTLRQARQAEDHRGVLLGLLAAAIDAGVDVSPAATSVRSPFKVLQYMNGFPARLTQAEVNREVANWQALHLVERETFKKASRHQGERLVLTDRGRALAVAPPGGANPPEPLQALMKRAA